MSERDEPLLSVEDLETHYPITEGFLRREIARVRAVDGVSFTVECGEAFGLVGESGSGKTTLARSILRLVEPTGGTVRFDGDRVGELSGESLRAFRRRVQLVVQDPNEAFNPRMSVGEAVAEPLVIHGMDDRNRRRAIVADLLERIGLSAADAERYPHEFSGGEKQRLSIARALAPNPDLIVADEPASALDARVRADVLGLLESVRREFGVSILYISHDLDTVRRFCDRVAVLYLGEIVERGSTGAVFDSPAHPYTRVLLGSVPSLDPADRDLVRPLTDTVPDPADPPEGCRFHTRCPELIAPEESDLSDERWRAVAAMRFALETGELPAAIVDGKRSVEELRTTLSLPEHLPDDRLDRAVTEALFALARGERETARERLSETVPSACERERPVDVAVDGRCVTCHRYDPAATGEPLPWVDR
ncbi:MAG: ATP-binding cassette domain-containing protein [Halalkalicoccus sp.]